jgi:hypothetical protein
MEHEIAMRQMRSHLARAGREIKSKQFRKAVGCTGATGRRGYRSTGSLETNSVATVLCRRCSQGPDGRAPSPVCD